MRLALRELGRRPGRFVTATVILTLVAVLVMFLGGLLDGLIRSSTNAVQAQDGDLLVFSSTAQSSLLRSRIDGDLRETVEAVDGVSETGGLGVVQLGARVPGNGPRDLASTALFGYELAPIGVPDPPGPGEVYADEVLQVDGVEEGMEILLGPARTPVTVIGFVSDTTLLRPGFVVGRTGHLARSARPPTVPTSNSATTSSRRSSCGPRPSAAVDDVATAIDQATDGATETLTIDSAVDAIPGVAQQRQTFNQIIAVTIAIGVVVVALFFALLTIERLALYGVLKAIGAHNRTLFAGLVTQAVVVAAIASVVAGGSAAALDATIPAGSIPLDISPSRIVTSAMLLFAAAIIGCTFSLRRVLRVDPASAIGTA